MKKAFIFDSDGVILNSEPEYMKQNMLYMDSVGISYNYEIIKSMVGTHENYQIEYFQKNHPQNLSFEEVKKEWYDFLDKHPFEIAEAISPNVDVLVKYLANKGYRMGIASNSSVEYVSKCARIAGVLDYMEFVMSGLGMSKPKPNPDIYLEAAKRLDVDPKECVVIEDSKVGIEAGKNAGMTVIALAEPIYGHDQHEADYIVNNLIEICEIEKNL